MRMISPGAGVGSHSDAYGDNEKKAHTLSATISPTLPVAKRTFARAGKSGIHKLAIRPIRSDQKQMSGSTSKLVNGATRENLLKWNNSRGKVPSMAAAVSATPARSHLRKVPEILIIIEDCVLVAFGPGLAGSDAVV
jgi:hypothetical protein